MDNNKSGFLKQILTSSFVISFVISGIIGYYNGTQYGMIKNARKNSTIEKYTEYLSKYPSGRYSTEAYNTIVSLWNAMDFESFQNQLVEHKALKQYEDLIRYNNAEFRKKLSEKMHQKCMIQYDLASKINTLQAWHNYIIYAPKEFMFDAQEKYQTVFDETWENESLAWNHVRESKGVEEYEKYIQKHPNGEHRDEVEKILIDKYLDLFAKMKCETLPPMSKTSNRSYAKSNVTINNPTSDKLTVLFSGTNSKRIFVEPLGQKTVQLSNGKYKIIAYVQEELLSPYECIESLTGGNYDVTYSINKENDENRKRYNIAVLQDYMREAYRTIQKHP